MTYRRAKLIIWNPDAYLPSEVKEAAVFILSLLNARNEDISTATMVLAFGR